MKTKRDLEFGHPYPGDPVVAQAIQAEIREVAGDGRRRK